MFNRLMNDKELNVKVGDRVSVQGFKGTVTEVFHSIRKEWNGTEYVDVAGTESTTVQVHFDEDNNYGIANSVYQDGHYGGYEVIE